VAEDAIKLVKRFDRDWIQTGRRPSGLCGAALILAARMNNFRRSVLEVVQVVKIGDATVRKRLEEFKLTGSAGLTVEEWRSGVELGEEADPPAFGKEEKVRAKREERERKKRERETEDDEEIEEEEMDEEGIVKQKRKGKRKSGSGRKKKKDLTSVEVESGLDPLIAVSGSKNPEIDNFPIDPMLQDFLSAPMIPLNPLEVALEGSLSSEVAEHLQSIVGQSLTAEMDQQEQILLQQRQREKEQGSGLKASELQQNDGELIFDDLDDDELDGFLLNDQEIEMKTRVWMEFNKDYLEKIAGESLDTTCTLLDLTDCGLSEKQRMIESNENRPKKTYVRQTITSNDLLFNSFFHVLRRNVKKKRDLINPVRQLQSQRKLCWRRSLAERSTTQRSRAF
jgi:transcription factor IIIB 90 kDa subunit